MTAAPAAAGGGDRTRWRRWLTAAGHYEAQLRAPAIALLLAMLLIDVWVPTASHLKPALDDLSLASGLLSCLLLMAGTAHSRMVRCDFCLDRELLGVDRSAQAQRRRRQLHFYHRRGAWNTVGLGGLACTFLTVMFNVYGQKLHLMSLPVRVGATVLLMAGVASVYTTLRIGFVHSRLRPWCPWCRGRDDRDIDVTPIPDPDPAGVVNR